MQENQEDQRVKKIFRSIFSSGDKKLARKLERQDRPERAGKVCQLARDNDVLYNGERRKLTPDDS